MPITDASGQVLSVMKVAADITDRVNKEHENQSIVNALSRSMAMIEFSPDGRVINANQNFLNTVHYSLQEIVGQHHSMFCRRSEAESAEYKAFGSRLIAANTIPDVSNGSINMATRFFWRLPTTRFSMPKAACIKW